MAADERRFVIGSLPGGLGAAVIAAVATSLLLGVRSTGWLESTELAVDDAIVALLREQPQPDPRVALVAIREADLHRHGQPLSDELLAHVLRILARHGPRAIGVDLYRDRPVPPGTQELRDVVQSEPGIVMIEKLSESGSDAVPAPEYVVGTGQVGFVDVKPDDDGRVRRGLLAVWSDQGAGISLALRLALRFLAFDPDWKRTPWAWVRAPGESVSTLHVRGAPIPRFRGGDGPYARADDAGYQIQLDPLQLRAPSLRITLEELLAERFDGTQLRGRIVLLGNVAPSMRDEFETPVGRVHGVEHHAELAGYVLALASGEASALRFPGVGAEAAIVALFAYLGAALGIGARSWWLLAVLVPGGLVAGAAALGARSAGVWLPALPIQSAFALSGVLGVAWASFEERAQRRTLEDLFGRFLPRDVARELWRERASFLEGGRPRPRRAVVTILMADLQGYTQAVLGLEADRLVTWVNEFLTAMAEITGAHGGIVDDYVGDGIMAIFGAPVPRATETAIAEDARAAVRCAHAMAAALDRLRADWTERSLPDPRLRIGICTGEAIVGVIGSPDRLKYGCLGDTVIAASRLESLHKGEFAADPTADRTRILVAESTFRLLDGELAAVDLGFQQLAGMDDRAVRVFHLENAPAKRGGER